MLRQKINIHSKIKKALRKKFEILHEIAPTE